MGPIDYTGGMQPANPLQGGIQAWAAGNAIRQQQMAQQQAQQQQMAQQAMQKELTALAMKPGATSADYASVMTRFPQFAEKLKIPMEALNQKQQEAALAHSSQVLSALTRKQPEVAASLLEQRAEAMANSGDTKGAERARAMAERARTSPMELVPTFAGLVLALPGGDKVLEGLGKLGAEGRASELHQPVLDKATADARQSVADATTKEATARYAEPRALAETQGAQAEAVTKGVTAKYAEQTAKQTLANLVASGQLSKAQAASAVALAKKYGAETEQIAAQAAGGDPSKKFDFEKHLRSEYLKQTGDAQIVKESYKRVTAAQNTAVGDIALIFGYMKMLDPGSVVREGEYATAEKARGVPESVMNVYNKILTGQRLTENQRKQFTSQAESLSRVADEAIAREQRRINPVIGNYKLNSQNIFGGQDAQDPTKPAAPAAGVKPAPAVGTVERGYRFKGGDPSKASSWEQVK